MEDFRQTREIQERSRELLSAFATVCAAHSLRWSVAGGTLLGAIRNGGFVPWDDDIDIHMPRADYDRLVAEMSAHPPDGTFWESYETNPATPHFHGKFCSVRRDVIACEYPMLKIARTLGLDVFPLDILPAASWKRQYQRVVAYICLHLPLVLWGGASPKGAGVKCLVRLLLSRCVTRAWLDRCFRRVASIERSSAGRDFVCLCGRYGARRERFKAAWFARFEMRPFDDMEVPVPCGAREMLAQWYGADWEMPKQASESSHYRLRPETDDSIDFSLVVATCGRDEDVGKFLMSVAQQVGNLRIEVILVDQNPDDRLKDVVSSFKDSLHIVWLRRTSRGVSRARNEGLNLARGRLVAFPDDDCKYEPDTLMRAKACFDELLQADGLVADTAAHVDVPITRFSAFRRGETWRFFFRRSAIAGMHFDESWGPGESSVHLCGEDTAFLLSALDRGLCVWRVATVTVVHPRLDTADVELEKVWRYALARMALLKAKGFPLWFKLANVLYPIAVVPFAPLRCIRYRLVMFAGRLAGLFRCAFAVR